MLPDIPDEPTVAAPSPLAAKLLELRAATEKYYAHDELFPVSNNGKFVFVAHIGGCAYLCFWVLHSSRHRPNILQHTLIMVR